MFQNPGEANDRVSSRKTEWLIVPVNINCRKFPLPEVRGKTEREKVSVV